ncbi:MAG: cation:proton antiporter [Acidimicrobiia bacterium]|nr:cation:proton antiporter [Acidimicrobiia bacterium]
MITNPLTALAVIMGAAAAAQWVSARLRLPSVLFLLAVGLAASPFIDPDALFGDLLFTGVGLGVAVLLFEGGASLKWRSIGTAKAPVIRLVTVGALITWIIASLAAFFILDLDRGLALLLGAILIVSGPTVVMPLLRVVRPREPSASILRWEGILIDPIGAGLAIVVLDTLLEEQGLADVLWLIVTTFGSGLIVGLALSLVVIEALRRRLIPDHLQVNMTLAVVVGSYALANLIRPEAGLVAVTVLGMAFANQRRVPSAHIVEFNEHLGATILGILFIVLGARVDLAAVIDNLIPSLIIIGILVVVARPLAVYASTAGTSVDARHRRFLMTLAPRGVVAAAVASLFAVELDHQGVDPGPLVPVVFTVVVGTVLLAGLGAKTAANRFRVARPQANGVALIGGGPFAIGLARELLTAGITTIHVGLTDEDERAAAQSGQLVFQGRLDGEEFHEAMTELGIRQAVALSGIDHLDMFVLGQIAEVVGTEHLYGLHDPSRENEEMASKMIAPVAVLPEEYTPERVHYLTESGVGVRTVIAAWAGMPGWLPVCGIDSQSQQVIFNVDLNELADDELVIQIGPGLNTTREYRPR